MSSKAKVKAKKGKMQPESKAGRGVVRKTNFKVKARPGSVVYVVGTFNQWDPAATLMEPDGGGCYIASLVLPAGRHEYKFLVDGAWHLDPDCPRCVPNAFGSQNHVIEID